jgi:hypothetical protein
MATQSSPWLKSGQGPPGDDDEGAGVGAVGSYAGSKGSE